MFRHRVFCVGSATLVAVLALAATNPARGAGPQGGGPAPVQITVKVPADAQVWFDGTPTFQTGTLRLYMTPPLATGKSYTYHVRARWMSGGKPVDQTRKLSFRSGDRPAVDFTAPETAGPDKSGTGAEKSLYERLGGEAAIKAVVDDFVVRAASDPKVNFTRKGTDKEWKATPENVALVKKHLVQFVGMATGGPQKYEGESMKAVHKGMKITNAEFDAAAADLKATLDKFKVPAKEQGELLKAVDSTRKDIVEDGAGGPGGQVRAPSPELREDRFVNRAGGKRLD